MNWNDTLFYQLHQLWTRFEQNLKNLALEYVFFQSVLQSETLLAPNQYEDLFEVRAAANDFFEDHLRKESCTPCYEDSLIRVELFDTKIHSFNSDLKIILT